MNKCHDVVDILRDADGMVLDEVDEGGVELVILSPVLKLPKVHVRRTINLQNSLLVLASIG